MVGSGYHKFIKIGLGDGYFDKKLNRQILANV